MRLPAFDKTLHFAAGSISAATGAGFGALAFLLHSGMAQIYIPVLAAASCAVAALLREVYNRHKGGIFDWRDVVATLLGGAPVLLGVAVGGLR